MFVSVLTTKLIFFTLLFSINDYPLNYLKKHLLNMHYLYKQKQNHDELHFGLPTFQPQETSSRNTYLISFSQFF